MKLYRYQAAGAFCDRTQAYLLRHEAEHNLLIGIQKALIRSPQRYPSPPDLLTVEAAGQVIAVGIRTPPQHLVLSQALTPTALPLMATALKDAPQPLRGVSGLIPETAAFLQTWQGQTGQTGRLNLSLCIHRLWALQPGTYASGNLRVAGPEDFSLLLKWSQAFSQEALGQIEDQIAQVVTLQIERGNLYLWQNPQPVAMAAGRWSSPGGGRIGPVYTPPDHRQRGYATACVAAVSQQLLAQGAQQCFLFTDTANPIARHIYGKIGYQPVCDWHDYSFDKNTAAQPALKGRSTLR